MKWNKFGASSGYTLVHDGWNRLVKVLVQSSYNPSSGGFTVLANTYNGLHWRIKSEEDVQATPNGTLQTTAYHFDASWRVIEERVTDGGAMDFTYAEYWGLRYIDDAVMRVGYDNYYGQSTYWHHLTDAQFSTIAMLDEAGTLRERIAYDPYGKARHRWGYDADGDGDVDNNDYLRVLLTTLTSPGNPPITDPAYDPDCDLNNDGVVDSTDVAIANDTSNWRSALPSGWIGDGGVDPNPPNPAFSNGPRNPFGYCGYMLNANAELYTVRFRHYAPSLGRWVERDPAGYVDGMSLSEYVASRPSLSDPSGLFSTTNHERITRKAISIIGLDGCADKLARAVKAPDDGAVTNTPPAADPLNHGDDDRIEETIERIRKRMAEIDKISNICCERDKAIDLLGYILHAAQDLIAHSNYVELENERLGDRAVLTYDPRYYGQIGSRMRLWELWDKKGKPVRPNGVKTGRFDWPGDSIKPGTHGEMNKDEENSLRGRMRNKEGITYYRLAEDMARQVSEWVLEQLPERVRNNLRDCCDLNKKKK